MLFISVQVMIYFQESNFQTRIIFGVYIYRYAE